MRYALGPRVVASWARARGAYGAIATAAPPIAVLIAVVQLHVVPIAPALFCGAVIASLALARGVIGYRVAKGRLAAFAIDADDAGFEVAVAGGHLKVASSDVARVIEIGGTFGGLRVELRPRPPEEDAPLSVVVPRGGEGFADLRALLSSFAPMERGKRRTRAIRLASSAMVVVGLFFLPFLVEDVVVRSRVAAVAFLAALFFAMRVSVRRD
jgi:hypothetical protein